MLRSSQLDGRPQMRKISLFAAAAVLTATGLGVWTTSSTNARIAPSIGQGTEPFQLMLTAKQLPTAEFVLLVPRSEVGKPLQWYGGDGDGVDYRLSRKATIRLR